MANVPHMPNVGLHSPWMIVFAPFKMFVIIMFIFNSTLVLVFQVLPFEFPPSIPQMPNVGKRGRQQPLCLDVKFTYFLFYSEQGVCFPSVHYVFLFSASRLRCQPSPIPGSYATSAAGPAHTDKPGPKYSIILEQLIEDV